MSATSASSRVAFAWIVVFALLASLARPASSEPAGWQRGAELSWPPADLIRNPGVAYRALVIGISDYASRGDTTGWRDLATAAADARAVSAVLKEGYGFEVTTLLDSDATREAIHAELDRMMDLGLDDAFVLYFAGHGFFDPRRNEGYWIPHDAAHRKGDRLAREDWIWNSAINSMLQATEARHVLVLADACYAGSLFRGEDRPDGADLHWYKRVNAKPSRYLISSGDAEPVSDEGEAHSAFAEHLLRFLKNPGKNIFSASDIGYAMREKVSAETGQMVRMGPLNLTTHAGGELVFMRNEQPAGEGEHP